MDSHPPRLEVPIIHYLHPPNIGGIGGVMLYAMPHTSTYGRGLVN